MVELLCKAKVANHHSSVHTHYDVIVAYVSVADILQVKIPNALYDLCNPLLYQPLRRSLCKLRRDILSKIALFSNGTDNAELVLVNEGFYERYNVRMFQVLLDFHLPFILDFEIVSEHLYYNIPLLSLFLSSFENLRKSSFSKAVL